MNCGKVESKKTFVRLYASFVKHICCFFLPCFTLVLELSIIDSERRVDICRFKIDVPFERTISYLVYALHRSGNVLTSFPSLDLLTIRAGTIDIEESIHADSDVYVIEYVSYIEALSKLQELWQSNILEIHRPHNV